MSIIVVPKYYKVGQGFTKQEKFEATIHPGRSTKLKGYQSPASWICDLVDLNKPILLCNFCKVKFNHARSKYRKKYLMDITGKSSGWVSNGQCDGCKQNTALLGGGILYMPEQEWLKFSQDPRAARRNAQRSWQTKQNSIKRHEIVDDMISNPNKYGKKHKALWKEAILGKGGFAEKRQQKKEAIRVNDKRRFK